MYNNIFDTHAHYDDDRFDDDRQEVFTHLQNQGVSNIINCGCNYQSSKKSIEFANENEFIYAAVGMHPNEMDENSLAELEQIQSLYANEKIVAVGEIGLDYHYDFVAHDFQKQVFDKQLALAKELDLPTIIHDREAHGDTLEFLQKYQPKGVVHCFSGSSEMALEIVKLGMYIGIGGAITFKNARRAIEVVQAIPLDRLLLETDAPYMTPVPFRGKRCDSAHIAYTAEKIAEVKGMSVQKIIDICNENAKRLFSIK